VSSLQELIFRLDGTGAGNYNYVAVADLMTTHINDCTHLAQLAAYELKWMSNLNDLSNTWRRSQRFEF
jgi:hypothetical protein